MKHTDGERADLKRAHSFVVSSREYLHDRVQPRHVAQTVLEFNSTHSVQLSHFLCAKAVRKERRKGIGLMET